MVEKIKKTKRVNKIVVRGIMNEEVVLALFGRKLIRHRMKRRWHL